MHDDNRLSILKRVIIKHWSFISRFEKECGFTGTFVAKALGGKTNPGWEKIQAIEDALPFEIYREYCLRCIEARRSRDLMDQADNGWAV